MKKTILVTGSAGFIGFHVAKKLLEEGNKVIGIDNLNSYYDVKLKKERNAVLSTYASYKFCKGEIENKKFLDESLKKMRIDTICHLAAQAGVRYSFINPSVYEKSNISGFLHVLEFARKKNTPVIYASSSSVYGDIKMPKGGFVETQETSPISFYGVTKKTNEMMAYAYHKLYGLHMTGLRFFTVYGPWGRPDMAYFSFVKAISENKPIDVYNFGKMKRDFTYIDDIVSGVIAAIQHPKQFELYNLGNSHTVTLLEFIQTIEKHLGKKAKLHYLPLQPGDMMQTFANINKAKRQLGFVPQTKIDAGLKAFVDWYTSYYHTQ